MRTVSGRPKSGKYNIRKLTAAAIVPGFSECIKLELYWVFSGFPSASAYSTRPRGVAVGRDWAFAGARRCRGRGI